MKVGLLCDDPAATAVVTAGLPEQHCRLVFALSDLDRALAAVANETVDVILLAGPLLRHGAADLTRRLLAAGVPAVLLVGDKQADGVFTALEGGALGIVAPERAALGAKLKNLARRFPKRSIATRPVPSRGTAHPAASRSAPHLAASPGDAPPILAIGASTGGPQALGEILAQLPRPFPAAVLIVQHVSGLFTPGFTSWLGSRTGFPVQIAAVNQIPRADEVLIAAAGQHLVYRSGGQLSYVEEPRAVSHRPSIDVFFTSLADVTDQSRVQPGMALLLTGMGRDGAEGLLRLRAAGWTTAAQDQKSSAVYGMPKAAADLGAAASILPLSSIAAQVARRFPAHRPHMVPESSR